MMTNLNKALILCAAVAPITQAVAQSKNKARPNILYILSDDHTAQAWGIYGGILADYAKTDNIKRLAEEGCVLDNAFCTNSISVPSRAAQMTGSYAHINGVRTLSDALDTDKDNIAKRLKDGGYQTAIVGKWHLVTEPMGFDYYDVFHDQGVYIDPVFYGEDAFDENHKMIMTKGDTIKGFSTDVVTDKSIDWIENRDEDKPFAMFCHFKATHEPWDFPERLRHIYDGVTFPEPANLRQYDGSESGRTFPGQQLTNLAWRWEMASNDPAKWWCKYPELPFYTAGMGQDQARSATYQKLIRDFLRCGAVIDENIGRLLEYLDKEGLAENTIVVYVADQGYFLGEHGMFDKRMMYEQPLKMPFVIRYPKEIPAGTRNDDIILNVDFPALLADYAGVKDPNELQGTSFRKNLVGDTPEDWRNCMYYRYWTQEEIRPAHFGIRTDRYKLIFLYGDKLDTKGSQDIVTTPTFEFYDLKVDPYEDKNRIDDPLYKNIIAQLKTRLIEEKNKVDDGDDKYPEMKKIMDEYYWK